MTPELWGLKCVIAFFVVNQKSLPKVTKRNLRLKVPYTFEIFLHRIAPQWWDLKCVIDLQLIEIVPLKPNSAIWNGWRRIHMKYSYI